MSNNTEHFFVCPLPYPPKRHARKEETETSRFVLTAEHDNANKACTSPMPPPPIPLESNAVATQLIDRPSLCTIGFSFASPVGSLPAVRAPFSPLLRTPGRSDSRLEIRMISKFLRFPFALCGIGRTPYLLLRCTDDCHPRCTCMFRSRLDCTLLL